MSKYVGLDLRLAQPPLPAAESSLKVKSSPGEENENEDDVEYLCGTQDWKVSLPEIWGKGTCCWVDYSPIASKSRDETTPLMDSAEEPSSNLYTRWPAYSPWRIGLWIEKGNINFTDASEEGVGDSR
jgi:hypothetical protein